MQDPAISQGGTSQNISLTLKDKADKGSKRFYGSFERAESEGEAGR